MIGTRPGRLEPRHVGEIDQFGRWREAGYEIGKATEWGKPVLCLYRPAKGRSLSAMISGSNRVTLKEYQSPTELPEIFEQFLQS